MTRKNDSKRIPLFDIRVSRQARQEVVRTLESGWLSTGPRVKQFEQMVAEYVNVKHTAAVSSCTTGLQVLLTTFGAEHGREIITTPFTFVSTAEAILATGATPILADIDPATLNIDPEEVARKITDRTMAVLAVDIGGYPADYPRLNKVCDHHQLPLLSDAAHSLCARLKGRSIPCLCDAAVFSFYSTKNLTCGEGGMIASRHKQVIQAARVLANHGLTSNAFTRQEKGAWKYDAITPGIKANMSDVHAAIGIGQMAVLEKHQKQRQSIARRYTKNLQHLSEYVDLPTTAPGFEHSWHLYVIRLNLDRLKIDRDRFIHLMNLRDIECGVHYQPLFELSFYHRYLELVASHYPNTVYTGQRVVSLPIFPHLTLKDVDRVCESVVDVIKRNLR